MYNIVHIESGKSVNIEQKGFDSNNILKEASEKLETDFDANQFHQYRIQLV